MPRLTTRLTKLLNVRTPIIVAPMANVFHPKLLASAASAGAFGFIGAGALSPEKLTEQLQVIRSELGLLPDAHLPVGVGFLSWILEKDTSKSDLRVSSVLEQKVQAIWFAFGDKVGNYVEQVRAEAPKAVIFVLVNSVEEALRATNEWKADVIVVQGNEAGGHGSAAAPHLSQLLIAVTQAIPKDGPVIIVAGGIATGPQIASYITLGAAGAVVGTRFLMTHESGYAPEKKAALLKADLLSTTRSYAFDEINKTVGWPGGVDGRGIANEIITDERKGIKIEERLANAARDKNEGKTSRDVIWAGVGAGLVSELCSTKELVDELNEGAIRALQSAYLSIHE